MKTSTACIRSMTLRNRGFTLLEALMALTVFAFVMGGLGILIISTVQTNAQARRMTAATTLALAQMETLRNMPYTSLASGGDGNNLVTATGAANGIYQRSWVVAANSSATGSSDVTVTVAWTDKDCALEAGGTTPTRCHSVTLPSIISP